MTLDGLFRAFLASYSVYYDVSERADDSPFDAEAVFSSLEEEYFLLRGLTLSETRISEFVYFAKRERLTKEELLRLDALAWERGLSAASPGPGHKRSDVTLIVLSNTADADAKALVRKCRRSKTYRLGIWGFSRYRLALVEMATGETFFGEPGTHLKNIVSDILAAAKKAAQRNKNLFS